MKSLSKKGGKIDTKKRLGKSKKHNKSKKIHKKGKKQQKGGFVINEYEGIHNIPQKLYKNYKKYRQTCENIKDIQDGTSETVIERLYNLIKDEHKYMTQPIKDPGYKYAFSKKGVNFKHFPGNEDTLEKLITQFEDKKDDNYRIILSNIYCLNKVFDGTEFQDDETNTYIKIQVKKDYRNYLKEHDKLVTKLFKGIVAEDIVAEDIVADDFNNLNTNKIFDDKSVSEEFKEESKSFLPTITRNSSRKVISRPNPNK
tara:strand:+ start:10679 stop:11446 length:768 start_codon:yes stop_codon:yes gene_type:complete